jgi:hypothetical protein
MVGFHPIIFEDISHFARMSLEVIVSRTVPSQVVSYMDRALPKENWQHLGPANVGPLAGLLGLIEQIPPELILLDSQKSTDFVLAVNEVKEQLYKWRESEFARPVVDNLGNRKPQIMGAIRNALVVCPDEAPASGSAELLFISDVELRMSLREDIGRVNRALANGEWKAATVLSGSVIEALLLWALGNSPLTQTKVASTAATLTAKKVFNKSPSSSLDEWVLYEFIEVAADLGIIEGETAIQSRLAKNFRNLIHPGRSQRLNQKCDRGTALSAVAGMELVIRDLA